VTTSEDAVAPVLRARAVRVELPGAKSRVLRRPSGSVRALVGLDLQVLAGDTVWVVGEPGEGANAVGRVLGGELAPTSGTVELAGHDLVKLRGRRRARSRRQLAWLGSESGSALDPKRTAVEVVAEAAAGSVRSVTSTSRGRVTCSGNSTWTLTHAKCALPRSPRMIVVSLRLLAWLPSGPAWWSTTRCGRPTPTATSCGRP
jgi:ABC-type glutathione transport system ATPase component